MHTAGFLLPPKNTTSHDISRQSSKIRDFSGGWSVLRCNGFCSKLLFLKVKQ
jgi:hypothetical protein